MFLALITSISLFFAAGVAPSKGGKPNTAPQSSWQQVSPYESTAYDIEAELELLQMANDDRAKSGLAPLKMDEGLVRAARAHATKMASQNQISHQFSGEPALTQRLAASSTLHLNRAGENVAIAESAEEAHVALMASPGHRDNLLSPNFNVAGFGVLRDGHRIYVAQDFGFSLPSYSLQQAQELVSASVEQLRAQAKMPRLQRINDESGSTQSSACAMAQADSLNAVSAAPGAYMLRYTSMTPEALPS